MSARVQSIVEDTEGAVGVIDGWGGTYMLELIDAGICGVMPGLAVSGPASDGVGKSAAPEIKMQPMSCFEVSFRKSPTACRAWSFFITPKKHCWWREAFFRMPRFATPRSPSMRLTARISIFLIGRSSTWRVDSRWLFVSGAAQPMR